MHSQQQYVSPYVEKSLAGVTDLYANELTFPLDKTRILARSDYTYYFSSLANILSKGYRKHLTLNLTRGHEAILGLNGYLDMVKAALKTKTTKTFFTGLVLNLPEEVDTRFIEQLIALLKALSTLGQASVKLVGKPLKEGQVKALIEAVKSFPISSELVLQPEHFQAQKELDERISDYQRDARIKGFGERAEKEGLLEAEDAVQENEHPRIILKNRSADKEMEIEQQVEASVELQVDVEKEQAPQDKENLELINRDEFISRAKAKAFKVPQASYDLISGHERRTWDHWLGNISQIVTGSGRREISYDFPLDKAWHLYREERDKEGKLETHFDKQGNLSKNAKKKIYHFEKNGKKVTLSVTAEPDATFKKTYEYDEPDFWRPGTVVDAATVAEDDASIIKLQEASANKYSLPGFSQPFHKNPMLDTLTIDACEALLKHQAKFQYGLDFQNLPAGFVMLERNVGGEIKTFLDYDERKAKLAKPTLFTVKLDNLPEQAPLAHSIVRQCLDSSLRLKVYYENMTSKAYPCENAKAFQKALPLLMQLPEKKCNDASQSIEGLLKAAKDLQAEQKKEKPISEKHFNEHLEKHPLFAFIKADQNLAHALKHWHEALQFNRGDLNAIFFVYEAYGEKGMQALFELWGSIQPDLLRHLKKHYFSALDSYLPLLEPRFKTETINILNRYAEDAKEASRGKKTDFKDPEDVKGIYAFWTSLFEQHCAAVGPDDLLTLVKAFQDFVEKVHAMGLSFYTQSKVKVNGKYPPVNFGNAVKSLPVALGRMITILNNAKPGLGDKRGDREMMWEHITDLDLQSNGAIRLITDNLTKAGVQQLILPQMKLSPEFFKEENDSILGKNQFKPEHGYYSLGLLKTSDPRYPKKTGYLPNYSQESSVAELIARSSSQEELEKNFYRYLASQEYRLSIGFYEKALQVIHDKFQDGSFRIVTPPVFGIQKALYALLAATTTGYHTFNMLQDEDTSLKQFTQACADIADTSTPLDPAFSNVVLREIILRTALIYLKPLPPMPHFAQLISMLHKTWSLKLTDLLRLKALSERGEKYQKFIWDTAALSGDYGFAIYEALTALVVSPNAKEEDLFRTTNLALKLDGVSKTPEAISSEGALKPGLAAEQANIKKMKAALISLINVFQLRQQRCSLFVMATLPSETNLPPGDASGYILYQGKGAQAAPTDLYVVERGKGIKTALKKITDAASLIEHKKLLAQFVPTFFAGKNATLATISELNDDQVLLAGKMTGHDPSLRIAAKLGDVIRAQSNGGSLNLFSNALALLAKIQSHPVVASQPPLAETDLLEFLDSLSEELAKNPGLDINVLAVAKVKEKFGQYFDPEFFRQLGNELDPKLLGIIKANFPVPEEQNLLIELLSSYASIEDRLLRSDTVKAITDICGRLSTAAEKLQFLKDLNKLNREKQGSLEELNHIFAEIIKRRHINDFTFILSCEEADKAANLSGKVLNYYRYALEFITDPDYKHPNLSSMEMIPLSVRMVLNSPNSGTAFSRRYYATMVNLHNLIALRYPNEKKGVLDIVDSYISHLKQPGVLAKPDDFDAALTLFAKFLESVFVELNSADLVRSLCDHYHKTPEELLNILKLLDDFKAADVKIILFALAALLNNDRDCDYAVVEKFIGLCRQDASLLGITESFFKSPPYPTFETLLEWHAKHQGLAKAPAVVVEPQKTQAPEPEPAKATVPPVNVPEEKAAAAPVEGSYQERMTQEYQAYNLRPCERENNNGYDVMRAKELALQFTGISFGDTELEKLDEEVKDVQGLTVEALKVKLQEYKKARPEARNHLTLLAVMAELLYRSKGAKGGFGKSYEMNTVQYLAVLTFLKSQGHITSEIATGEGKSRIMMMAIACAFAQGKTVDFVTSDMQLAARDYLEYQAFFKILGAETSLIYATSDTSNYKKQGINFSDASNLSLFRNKARSCSKGEDTIDGEPKDRALLLDEADRTYFDVSETRYNFSQEANDSIKDMEWVYPLLVRFFTQENPATNKQVRELYEFKPNACDKEFIRFVQAQPKELNGFNEEQLERLMDLPREQRQAWQEAAVTALDLKFDKDYALETNILINTAKGPKMASEARLIYGDRISHSSKFSFGVHQCLHAYLNLELKKPDSFVSKECAKLNLAKHPPQEKTHDFFLHPEKQIVYSSTSKSFLDEYDKGNLWAVTGTAGAVIEREEASLLFGKEDKDKKTSHPMEFVGVPRNNPLQREDLSVHLAKNFKAKIKTLAQYIMEARKQNRPVLLICEDDQEAKALSAALEPLVKAAASKTKHPLTVDQWQFVGSTTSSATESAIVDKAGLPRTVTISTNRLGRGTDIKLKIEALLNQDPNKKPDDDGGLRVLASFLPRERDLQQIFGRGGRYGNKGDARIVVDRDQLRRLTGQKNLDPNFFLSNEYFVKALQMRIDREKQMERLVRNSISDFRFRITDNFFAYYDSLKDGLSSKEKNKKIMAWSDFTKKTDQMWNQVWPRIVSYLIETPVNMFLVQKSLEEFKLKVQDEWRELHGKLEAPKSLEMDLSSLKLDPRTEHLMRVMMPKRKYTLSDRAQVYSTYDSARDGRAVVYDKLFADWKAIFAGKRSLLANTRAWLSGRGVLFANTRAWWAGKRPLFANLRAWIKGRYERKAVVTKYRKLFNELVKDNELRPEVAKDLLKICHKKKSFAVTVHKYRLDKTISPKASLKIAEIQMNKNPNKKQDLLEVLDNNNKSGDLKRLVHEVNAADFLACPKDDLHLSYKIELVEAVLDFAHSRLEKGAELTKKDMADMKTTLRAAKASYESEADLTKAVKNSLQHSAIRFFGASLRTDVQKVVEQREEEEALRLRPPAASAA